MLNVTKKTEFHFCISDKIFNIQYGMAYYREEN